MSIDLEAMGRDAAALVVSHPQFRGVAGHIWELVAEVERLTKLLDVDISESMAQHTERMELRAEVKRLKKELEIAQKFHDVAVKERDLARHQVERLKAEARAALTAEARIEAALAIPKREQRKNGVFTTDWRMVVNLMVKALKGRE